MFVVLLLLLACITDEEFKDRIDRDDDGVDLDNDCDDDDASVGSASIWYPDGDSDDYGNGSMIESCYPPEGYVATSGDCDDDNGAVYPGAVELCDGADNDCNDDVDDVAATLTSWPDSDGDGFGDEAAPQEGCPQEGYVDVSGDCDDTNSEIYPGADEHCDGVDENCAGDGDSDAVDASTWFEDRDGDGHGVDETTEDSCERPTGYVASDDDCDDTDAEVNPEAEEICDDGVDQDCDGSPGDCVLAGDLGLPDADAALLGAEVNDSAGWYVSYAGDVDGDGFDDILISAINSDYGAEAGGAVYTVDGPPDSTENLSDHYVLYGEGEDDRTSDTVGLGDVDGDGIDDFAVGASHADADGVDAGATYVFLDSHSGTQALSNAEVTLFGTAAADYAGHALAASDIDDDGINEVVVGAYGSDIGDSRSGTVYIVSNLYTEIQDLADADALLVDSNGGEAAGYAVTGGDIDGDGYGDVVTGAIADSADRGVLYVVLGPMDPFTSLDDADQIVRGVYDDGQVGVALAWAGDTDGDGIAEFVAGAPYATASSGEGYLISYAVGEMDTSVAEATLLGSAAGAFCGYGVAGGGDVDADGHSDLVIGAINDSSSAGALALLLGPVSGTVAWSDADARILGEDVGDQFGASVAVAGDVNADGYSDIIGGAIGDDSAGAGAGAAYLFYGGGM